MTDQELQQLAREYVNANWISESEAYYEGKRQISKDDILPIFMWISSRYCLVEKSEAEKLARQTFENDKSNDYSLIDGLTDWVLDNFSEEYNKVVDNETEHSNFSLPK